MASSCAQISDGHQEAPLTSEVGSEVSFTKDATAVEDVRLLTSEWTCVPGSITGVPQTLRIAT